MSDLDAAIAALAPRLSQVLLALSQDGSTASLPAHTEALLEAAQDLQVAASDPAAPPTYAGWGAGLTKEGPVEKRTAFYIPASQFDENGFIPSVVTEGEPGHAPLVGNGANASPWYWGKTYEQAKAMAAKANADKGLSAQDVIDIVASSMRL